MPVDPDDATAIALDYAMRDLIRLAHRHAYPDMILGEWLQLVASVLLAGAWHGRSLESLMLLCARRVISDVTALA